MKKLLAFVLPILLLTEATALAVPPVNNPTLPTNPPTPVERTNPAVKKFVKLQAKNAFANPGDTKTVEATLTLGTSDNGVAGKSVRFTISGKKDNVSFIIVMGSGVTNAQGKATANWKVTDLPQGPYTLTASFAGDSDTAAASDEANFGVFKGLTEFELSDLAWDGPNGTFGTIFIAIKRKSDNGSISLKEPSRKFSIYVNGALTYVGGSSSYSWSVAFPVSGTSWDIRVLWTGDDTYQGSQASRHYQRP